MTNWLYRLSVLIALTGLGAAAFPQIASADRHCAPVLYKYYDARSALADAGPDCDASLARSTGFLSEAVAEARACGCNKVETTLTEFLRQRETVAQDCNAAGREILQLDELLPELVEGCH